MASVFPLKAILDTRSARFLEDVVGADSASPRIQKVTSAYTARKTRSLTSSVSVSIRSTISEFNSDDFASSRKFKLYSCLAIIIEDAVDQMHILSFGKKSDRCLEKFKMSLDERITDMLYENPIYDMETGDPYEVSFAKRKLNKNLQDCAVCKEFLTIIKNEMRSERTYSSVRDIMNTIINTKQAETKLLQDEVTNYAKMKDFKHMLITHSRDYQVQMQKVNEILASSEDRAQELLFENLLRVRYINYWEKARMEQNSLSCKKNEMEMEAIISKYQNEIEKEIRIHTEITTYIMENLTDLERDMKYWVSRYDSEMDSRNIQIQIMRDHKEDQEKAHQKLKDIFALHKRQIQEFIAYKEKKKFDETLRERQIVAAIKIQAWWRGQMVRHKLGRFNPKRKGKKGKDKDKKKKK